MGLSADARGGDLDRSATATAAATAPAKPGTASILAGRGNITAFPGPKLLFLLICLWEAVTRDCSYFADMTEPLSYLTCSTSTVTAGNGVTYAYRRLGPAGGVPLVLLIHFRGNLDNWDPALVDLLAGQREVIVFDNTGVGGTSGRTPSTISEMAGDAVDFLSALGLEEVDLLGFSIGSFVAQEVTLHRAGLVRRLILASAAPQGARGMHGWVDHIINAIGAPETTGEGYLHAFFRDSETSRAAGTALLGRLQQRVQDPDAPTTWQTRNAQYDAVLDWGIPDHSKLERLAAIGMPVYVANGDDDQMILPQYSHLIAGLIPGAQLKLYPDSAHGFLFQHHGEFAADVNAFLDDRSRT